MARISFFGGGSADPTIDCGNAAAAAGLCNARTLPSGFTYDGTIVRADGKSLKIVAASGTSASLAWIASSTCWVRFALRVTARPATTARSIFGNPTAGGSNLQLNANGTITYNNGAGGSYTSSTALTDTSKWYVVQMASTASASVTVLKVDSESVTGNGGLINSGAIGPADAVADTYTIYITDAAADNADFPGDGSVVWLAPASDNTVGSGWTDSGGAATGLFASVDNSPPVGIADTTSSAGHQIRNASSAAASYIANLETYTAGGVPTGATVNAVRAFASTAAPVSTNAKSGTLQITTNPAEGSATAFPAGSGSAGQFWNGSAAGTYPTGWKRFANAIVATPSVTLGTAPQLTLAITAGTASRIAMCCEMGMYVDYTPAAAAGNPPPDLMHTPMFQSLIAQ
jgi:hypothetical protein